MEPEEALIANQILHDLVNAEEQIVGAIPRRFYVRQDPFELPDTKFIKLFRLTKHLTRQVIEMVTPFMVEQTRQSALTIETKVLVTLKFFGMGSYQEITGSNIFTGVSQPSVSRCIREVIDALNNDAILQTWIHFPHNVDELQNLRNRFYRKYGFPGVVGVLDCTHVAIVTPQGDMYPEHIYVNRKNYHSINVQLICDENLTILHCNARYPGSCHDSYIWRESNVSRTMERVYRRNNNNLFFLLGDSGYPLRPWLMTPIRDPPPGTPSEMFNNSLKAVRSIIERCNGVLKNRFRCLLKHRVLHYSPTTSSKIILSCVVLHNMCITNNVPEPEPHNQLEDIDFEIHIEDRDYVENNINPDLITARQIQQEIIATRFY